MAVVNLHTGSQVVKPSVTLQLFCPAAAFGDYGMPSRGR